jgi:predicted nucleotidyltransferase
MPVLERLVRAAGSELDVSLRDVEAAASERSGPVARRLFQHGEKIRDVVSRHGLSNPRVFGSVARGQDTLDSDLDILIDVGSGVGLLTLARCERDLEALLGVRVDLVPADDLKPAVASSVLAEARPL